MKKVISLVVGFALLGTLIYAAYVLITMAWTALSTADPQFSAAVATGATVLLGAAITLVGGRYFERQATIAKEIRDKKVPVYEDLLKFMFKIFAGVQQGKPVSPDEMNDFLLEFTQRLLVWGSDEVIASWGAFRQGAGDDPKQLLLAVEKVIASIRRDLGHSNANLKPGDLLSLFVTDAKHVFSSSYAETANGRGTNRIDPGVGKT